MTNPNVAPVVSPAVKPAWGSKPPSAIFQKMTPEAEREAKQKADADARVLAVENAARFDQTEADKLVKWALAEWGEQKLNMRNGGDSYKNPVTMSVWNAAAAKWSATQIPGHVCSTRSPQVKRKEGNLNIGKLTGNIEVHDTKKGTRWMDLHVPISP